ncbi:MAG: TusA-related sulfurtransferase [Candidatus Deianiraeaceae bacterium]|jgi:TusA-related sulfurtransferase
MQNHMLDLRNVKCPMNLIMIKNILHEGKLVSGVEILINNAEAQINIINYLKLKNINFSRSVKKIFIL